MLSCSWDPGPWLFCEAGQGHMGLRGKATGFGLREPSGGGVCSWDERETAGSWAVCQFVPFPSGGSRPEPGQRE